MQQDALDSIAWEWAIVQGRTVTIGLKYSLKTQDVTLNLSNVFIVTIPHTSTMVDYSTRVQFLFSFLFSY